MAKASPRYLDEMMRAKDPARSKTVTDALLKMAKLDIAALEYPILCAAM